MLVKITAVYGGSGVRAMGGCTPPILGHLFCNTVGVDFKSAYAHGFARIAACTLPIAIGLAVAAVIVLAGLLHPRSIDALERAG